jgi:predicted nucleic acid-binding Zn ribbon protein
MPTYVYETIPQHAGEQTVRFEVEQRMTAPALKTHPDTGVPVQRVISGGAGFICDRAAGGGDGHGGGSCACHP